MEIKQQIRISSENELGQLIKDAIYKTMHQEVRIPGRADETEQRPVQKREEKLEQTNFDFQAPPSREDRRIFKFPEEEKIPSEVVEETSTSQLTHETTKEESSLALAEKAKKNQFDQEVTQQFPTLEYIGQLHGTYLLTQNEEGLFFIDQHAAQERIKYEYYKKELAEMDFSMQDLLVPIVLEYPSDEVMIINENLDTLADAGIQLEAFGQNSFIVREHPTWFVAGQEQGTIEEMIDFFLEEKNLTVGLFREATAIMMSCKRSIKANHRLSDSEAISLIEQLPHCENPYNCPHGRPVLVKLTTYDLEKMFKRIQDRH